MKHAPINMQSLDFHEIPASTRDIRLEALDEHGHLKVLPAEFWQSKTMAERALFGQNTGTYGFPTTELITWLRDRIDHRSAIEIGAGNGVLAHALGIPATDSLQQERPEIRKLYAEMGQAPVKYGPNVIHLDAARAVAKYKPKVVIGNWVTHKYDRRKAWLGGNKDGIDENALLHTIEEYILVGNVRVHRLKPTWDTMAELIYPGFLASRAYDPKLDFIGIWKGRRAPT